MNNGVLYVLVVAGVVIFAAFVVPWVAERVVRRDFDREDGWLHAHEQHERKEPKRGRATDRRKGNT